jgi:hypothetical protein
MKVHVLFGATGEYSDRSEWIVCAYTNKGDADADCAALNARAEGLLNLSWAERNEAVAERLQPHDANAQSDYTGTWYAVEEVEVFDRQRVPSWRGGAQP